ncbi:arylformamidase [Hyphobacterium sp. HN65]|uniref:Kynurenine formamidase n=1 Tax=Hyphobacterium lacteum TaxID=3116575 RepID=A0ABU7LM59_9PROT|nr:arylformamidase [Hyphobacterium sp. HN65]MEE2524967.1 arylformamidase [Hyphobacterium sp. HN65]
MAGRVIDISQTLRPALPVWPGDTAFKLERTWHIEPGCPVNVSRLTLSTHSGAHADAPLHYDENGKTIDQVDPAIYVGRCFVFDVREARDAVRPEHFELSRAEGAERILFRTFESFPHDRWVSDYAAIAPETIDLLAASGAQLVGMDGPSLDPETSKTLDAHNAVRRAGMAILEGLVLDDIPQGHYELIAAPLKIEGADAAPVRALLREIG